jgi:lipopolysaccharide assembly protein A
LAQRAAGVDNAATSFRGLLMRHVYAAVLAVIVFVVAVFMVQNLPNVTVGFFTARLTMPLSIILLLVYVAGMLTGSMAWSLLRTSVRGAKSGPAR